MFTTGRSTRPRAGVCVVRLLTGELLKGCIQLRFTTPVAPHGQVLLGRMSCGRLPISLPPAEAHRSRYSNATLKSGNAMIVVAYPGLMSGACATHRSRDGEQQCPQTSLR